MSLPDLAYRVQAPRVLWRAWLTPCQAATAELVAQGLTNREIAARMFVAEPTVKFHVSQVLGELRVRNRVELTRWWILNVEVPVMAASEAASGEAA